MEDFSLTSMIALVLEYGIPLLKAILIFIIGRWLIKRGLKLVGKIMIKRDYELTLQKFVLNIGLYLLWILLLMAIVGVLGVPLAGFAAILGGMALAIGLALQGSLSNFAGGVLLLLFKPFKVGDVVEAQGITGTIQEIDILQTKVLMFNRKTAIIPNGPLLNGNIINFDASGILRVETEIGVSYDADIPKTIETLRKLCTDHPLTLEDPAPVVEVVTNADSSINILVRPYTLTEDHWPVYFYLQKNFKPTLDSIGVEIPYPHQVEIHKEG
jgi:small conductance mechanosensitive channel